MTSRPSPWNLGGLPARELARRVWREIWHDDITDRAAALAYYLMFALFPALLFLTALLGFLPVPDLMGQLMGYLGRVLPGDAASLLQRTLGEITGQRRETLLSIGALLALWSASAGMASVVGALNVAYDLDDTRSWWTRRLVALALTLGFAVFVVGALALLVFGPQLGGLVGRLLGLGEAFGRAVGSLATIPLAITFAVVGTALVYYLAPAGRQRWRWVTPGSVVAVPIWILMSLGLRWYTVSFGSYTTTYGSIGGAILLMLWLYLTGLVLLVGAEINAEIEHEAARRGEPTAKLPGQRAAA